MPNQSLDIAEIIRRLRNDDKSALDDIFNNYYPRLFTFSKKILKIEIEIDDILQDVFLKIWLNRHKIGNHETFNAYIFTITKNAILNLIRAKIKDKAFKDELFKKSVATEYITQQQYDYEEIRSEINKLITELPEKRQTVFLLSRSEGLSNKEIALKMEISEKTVEDHITHSIRFLKNSLRKFGFISILYLYLFL